MISIIITHYNRLPHLQKMLKHNSSVFNELRVEVVIVDFPDNSSGLDGVLKEYSYLDIKLVNISGRFNKSRGINIGVDQCFFEKIFLLDVDILINRSDLDEVINNVCFKKIIMIQKVEEIERQAVKKSPILDNRTSFIQFSTIDNRLISVKKSHYNYDEGYSQGTGLIALMKEEFIKIGGMDSEIVSWGWEDVDILIRHIFKFDSEIVELGSVKHLTHENNLRNIIRQEKQQSELNNSITCIQKYEEGIFKGSFEKDVQDFGSK